MEPRRFDLNIEKILENWDIYHAIREIIANALDEEILTESKRIQIRKDKVGRWHFRDFGRGLRYTHLTQKENPEKLRNPHVIGKFGIGLKDALATLHRKNIKVRIQSRFGDITLGKSEKHGFKDIVTLHAYIQPASDPRLVGTDVVIYGCRDEDIRRAKELFLRFSGEKVIEKTTSGEVLAKRMSPAKIYVNGVRVAEEENFLFSYNITSINKKIRDALNRERTNVGRRAYTDRVKAILLACKSKQVASDLVEDLSKYEDGTQHDELEWLDVSVHACKLLNSLEKVVFLTPEERTYAAGIVNKALRDGYRLVTIPMTVKEKIRGLKDYLGTGLRDLEEFQTLWNQSFQFKFVKESELKAREKEIFALTPMLFGLAGGKPKCVKEVKISETMRINPASYREAEGLWEADKGRIIIKRSCLSSIERFAGTLLHEVCHATSGEPDISDRFEQALTGMIGRITGRALVK